MMMTTKKTLTVILGAAALAAICVPRAARAGQVFRLSSEAICTGESGCETSDTTPFSFYTKTITVPTIGSGGGAHFLEIDFSGVGDVHAGNGTVLGCLIDGNPCDQPGSGNIYMKAQASEDEHDNSINASFCTQAAPGTHTVELQMASDGTDTSNQVFMEAGKVTISAARLSQGNCVDVTP